MEYVCHFLEYICHFGTMSIVSKLESWGLRLCCEGVWGQAKGVWGLASGFWGWARGVLGLAIEGWSPARGFQGPAQGGIGAGGGRSDARKKNLPILQYRCPKRQNSIPIKIGFIMFLLITSKWDMLESPGCKHMKALFKSFPEHSYFLKFGYSRA